jgi:hypothetical protein
VRSLRLIPILLLAPLFLGADSAPLTPSAATIAEETQRAERVERHVMSFWWLPVEYWVAVARELKQPQERIERTRELLRDYLIMGVLDAQVGTDGKFRFASLEDANERLLVVRNGTEVTPVPSIDPAAERMLPELAYFLTTSLGPLAAGLRLALYPNIDDKGRPLMSGSGNGTISAKYRPVGTVPISLLWRAPLTSVVGSQTCPRGGEELDASWSYCPWHGVPVE